MSRFEGVKQQIDELRCSVCTPLTEEDVKRIIEECEEEIKNDQEVQDFLEAKRLQIIMEKVKCDQTCMKRYKTEKGTFKGAKGERFDNCVRAFENCCTGVTSAEGLCAHIGRSSGKI